MAQYKIAHIREQGQDMIIVPLDHNYGCKSNTEQNEIRSSLQAYAQSAGLAGRVVTVWDAGAGRMGFIAPAQWQSFFSSIGLNEVFSSCNKTLTCN